MFEAGLSVTFIEAPLELQKQFPNGVPEKQKTMCRKQQIPTVGNCAWEHEGPLRRFTVRSERTL